MQKLLICLLACVVASEQVVRWQNSYDQPLDFSCPNKQTISYVKSQHDNQREDRLWAFSCQNTFNTDPDCYWSEYVNGFDEEFSYQCPFNAIIAGMHSYHEDPSEDRRWKFYCCRINNACNHYCQWTSYVNYFDELFSWKVPYQHYLVGAESYHDNEHEDRRWKYYYCARKNC